MSKARLVITAVVLEGRPVSEVVAAYGVSRSWVYELVARYRAEGDAAFEARSRRPKRSPTAIEPAIVELICELRRRLVASGSRRGRGHDRLASRTRPRVRRHPATIHRILVRAGLITPAPKKRPKASYRRFEADLANECWQSDFTHCQLADGTETEILAWIDDCSRYLLRLTAHRRVTRPDRRRRVPGRDRRTRYTRLNIDRQRHGLHDPLLRRSRRTQRLRDRTAPARHPTKEQPAEPSDAPAAKSNDSTRPSNAGSTNNPPPTHSPSYKHCSTSSRTIYNTERPHRSLPTPRDPRRHLHHTTQSHPRRTATTPTTGSVTTSSTPAAPSPCASTAGSTTSASDEPTPEPTSSCSSTTTTSASCTPPPANSSATSPSTPAATTNPPDDHQAATTTQMRVQPSWMSREIRPSERHHLCAGRGRHRQGCRIPRRKHPA